MSGGVQNKLSPEPLRSYYTVVQWATVRLMLIFQCIIGFKSQIIDFTNDFSQADISIWETVFIELPRNFKIDGLQCDVVLVFKKILYGQATQIWHENFKNGLLDSGFVEIEMDPCLFVPKTMICVVYVDCCLFWECSQYNIYNTMKSFKEYRPS